MLDMYRQKSAIELNAHAQKFLEMTPDERMELLFYMAASNNDLVLHLHGIVCGVEGVEVVEVTIGEQKKGGN